MVVKPALSYMMTLMPSNDLNHDPFEQPVCDLSQKGGRVDLVEYVNTCMKELFMVFYNNVELPTPGKSHPVSSQLAIKSQLLLCYMLRFVSLPSSAFHWQKATVQKLVMESVYIWRVDKQRCITTSFFESAYLISKFAEFYALSCWQKCI